jgi:hypothetical protein
MTFNIEYPVILLLAALICSPALFPLSRFFFDDIDMLLEDLGYRKDYPVWWIIIMLYMPSYFLRLKAFGFFGCFGILVGLTYTTATKIWA